MYIVGPTASRHDPVAEPNERPPLVVALEWVSKITTVALEMVVPTVIGGWLDRHWGTNFLALIGLAVGLIGGIWHLIMLTGTGKDRAPKGPKSENSEQGSEH
jgi:ATP synthase protein I